MRMLRKSVLGHSPLALFVLLCSLLGIGYSAAGAGSFAPVESADINVRGLAAARNVSLVIMAGCSLLFLLSRTAAGFRAGLAVKVTALLLYLAVGPYQAGIEVAVVAPLLLEIAIYEAFFLNLIFCLAAVALSLPLRVYPLLAAASNASAPANDPFSWMLPRLSFLLYLVAFAVVACFLVHYREKCIDHGERIGQLEEALARLTETNLGYQNYASEASSRSQKEERLRITRELHDTIGYTFTNNIMMLEAAVSKIHKDPQKVRQLVTLARASMESGLESIRKTLYLLRSQESLRVPSTNKICELVRVFRIATGIDVRVDFTNFPREVEHEYESVFYAFLQQALTNAFRHGAATSITVNLARTDGTLIATVNDNGRGADVVTEGIGIAGMRERLEKLGGKLRISAMPNNFQIAAEVPYTEENGDGC